MSASMFGLLLETEFSRGLEDPYGHISTPSGHEPTGTVWQEVEELLQTTKGNTFVLDMLLIAVEAEKAGSPRAKTLLWDLTKAYRDSHIQALVNEEARDDQSAAWEQQPCLVI